MLRYYFFILCLAPCFYAWSFSICQQDTRAIAFDTKIGRLSTPLHKEKICTATLIGKDCAITAGHCFDALEDIEFNAPLSIKGETRPSQASDRYKVYRRASWSKYRTYFLDKYDWLIFKIHKNETSGLYPGEKYGFYPINYERPSLYESIYIAGYGMNEKDHSLNYVLQSSRGQIQGLMIFQQKISYDADTMGGHSGSAILNSKNEIIGIHTSGGCDSNEDYNHGVPIYNNRELHSAIDKCLKLNLE